MSYRAMLMVYVALLTSSAWAAEFDVVLRNGRVVDATGNPARFADVAVKDGRIAAIGRGTGVTAREVDVRGLVAPGFIDVHTHAENIDDLPRGENFVRMGVTRWCWATAAVRYATSAISCAASKPRMCPPISRR